MSLRKCGIYVINRINHPDLIFSPEQPWVNYDAIPPRPHPFHGAYMGLTSRQNRASMGQP